MERDRSRRIGAVSFDSFAYHPFFAELNFDALERKEIPPVFRPSSDKTNFDATYDLEELLLEEAPLEARARRQKPRAELRDDATAKEIREHELHHLIETMFEPFDYTLVSYQGYVMRLTPDHLSYVCLIFSLGTPPKLLQHPQTRKIAYQSLHRPPTPGSFRTPIRDPGTPHRHEVTFPYHPRQRRIHQRSLKVSTLTS